MAQSDFITFLRIAHRVIGEYLKEADGATPPSTVSAAPAASEPVAGNGAASARTSSAIPAIVPSSGKGSRFDEVRAVTLREVIERTGYPEEMLELDLDLEGELGIDTVKQVAAISSVREHFQLDIDPNFRLRDHNTLRKVITHVAGRLELTGV